MVRLETRDYRIEECHNTPLRFALDRKERRGEWIELNNIGWFNCYEHAVAAMAEDVKKQSATT